MKELIGKKINKILVNSDQSVLIFDTDQGDVAYETYADCCSETWFADITGVAALLGGTVATVEEVDIEVVEDGRTRQEEDCFYGVKIVTDKGHAAIVYRNSSNGYYGGSADYTANFTRPADLTEISEDWSA